MRSHKFFTVFLLGLITVAITIVFIFWGIGPQKTLSSAVVAEIEGERITRSEFDDVYYESYRRARESYSEEELEKLDLRKIILGELIDKKVLVIAARDAGVNVTEDEVQDEWRRVIMGGLFREEGVFNEEIYKRWLKRNHMTHTQFKSNIMNRLRLYKISRLIGETVELTENEKKLIDLITASNPQLFEAVLLGETVGLTENDRKLLDLITESNPRLFEAVLQKRGLAIKAYVEGLKRKMKITINKERIS